MASMKSASIIVRRQILSLSAFEVLTLRKAYYRVRERKPSAVCASARRSFRMMRPRLRETIPCRSISFSVRETTSREELISRAICS